MEHQSIDSTKPRPNLQFPLGETGISRQNQIVIKYADKIPYVFISEHLTGVEVTIKPMFGCYGVYAHGKLCLFLMNRQKPLIRRDAEPMQKGVYVATTAEHAESFGKIFTSAEFEFLKGGKVWIFLSETLADFEQYVVTACEMMKSGDGRIGR